MFDVESSNHIFVRSFKKRISLFSCSFQNYLEGNVIFAEEILAVKGFLLNFAKLIFCVMR